MKNAQYPITTILFDMDNTLFDLVGAQIASCHTVATSLGREDGDDLYAYFLRSVHGYEAHENILDYMKDRGISANGLYTNARHIYEVEKLRHIIPYPGVIETLHRIQQQGLPMGIVTDAHSRDAVLRMEKSGLLSYFSGMVTYDMVKVKKPSPEPFLAALEMLKADPRKTLLIGDSPRRDIEPGRNLGIRTVYARYGDRFTDDRSIVQADFIIDTIDELPGILLRLSEKPE
jgi:putative hydrolase of the HAD superfamily